MPNNQLEFGRADRADPIALPMKDSRPSLAPGTVLYHRDLARDSISWADGLEELIGSTPPGDSSPSEWWVERIHPADRDGYARASASVLKGGAPMTVEYRVQASDGRWVDVLDQAVLVPDRRGGPALIFGVIHDLGRLRNWQNAHQVMDELLAKIFHDIRTPVSSILIWVGVLKSGDLDQGKSSRALVAIEDSATAITGLLEELSDLSLMVTGKLRLRLRPMPLGPAIESAFSAASASASAKEVRLEKTVDPDVGQVAGDAGRIEQLVRVLLTSAITRSARGGMVNLALARSGGHARLTVRFDEPGIGAEMLPDIFEWRTSMTLRGGFSLPLARHLTLLHDGVITAESLDEGGGGVFTVLLPLINEDDLPRLAPKTPPGH